MNSDKKILIIGGGGYLGSVLTKQLLGFGYSVRVMDAFLFGRKSLLDLQANPRLEIAEGDIRSIHKVTDCLDGVSGVILLAALVGESACEVNPKETLDINLLATKAVAEACKHYKIERLIFASTDSVYGIREGVMREDSGKNPISLYARLKLQAEGEILSLHDQMFRPTILRMSSIYGYSPRMRFDLVVNVLAMHATVNGRIKILGGKQWRPFVHVADAAKAYRLALEAPLNAVGGQIFNIGSSDQNYRIEQLGLLVNKVFPDVMIETIPESPDLRDYYVNCDKVANVLGYTVENSVVDGIREIKEAIESGRISDPAESRFYNVHCS